MTYTEAVELAKRGEDRGFGYLYQNTCKSKLHLALQYMKNTEDAKDVLQDSYMRAFSRLDTLKDPERFPAWFGQIVANTAKNALVKKNPMLFSDMASEEIDEPFEFRIEDPSISSQPELSYTKEETRTMVREMLDGLSPEQKMCVLMFHIEGASIRDIAQTLNCSENTVKSRLNYGRKNIKKQAEELQKKGYKLYGLAPLALFVLLLRKDAYAMSAEEGFNIAANEIAENVFQNIHTALGTGTGVSGTEKALKEGAKQGAEQSVKGAGQTAAGNAAKAGLLHTAAGKIIIGIVGAAIIGGGITAGAVVRTAYSSKHSAAAQYREGAAEAEAEGNNKAENNAVKYVTVSEDDYPNLIEGALTKEEAEFVFTYGPAYTSGEMKEGELTETDYDNILRRMMDQDVNGDSEYRKILTHKKDDDFYSTFRYSFSKDEINRLFSSFTDFSYSENKVIEGAEIDGEYAWLVPTDVYTHDVSSASNRKMKVTNIEYGVSYDEDFVSANISEAFYLDDVMIIYYNLNKGNAYVYDNDENYHMEITTNKKAAVLRKNDSGSFRIVSISNASEVDMEEEFGLSFSDDSENSKNTSGISAADIRNLYEQALKGCEKEYCDFQSSADAGGEISGYSYFLYDMDSDGVSELIIGAEYEEDASNMMDCIVFQIESGENGCTAKQITGDFVCYSLYQPSDGKGLIASAEAGTDTGEQAMYRYTIKSGSLSSSEIDSVSSDENKKLKQKNKSVEWFDISDLSGLDNLN